MTWDSHDARLSWARWVAEDPARSTGYVDRIRSMTSAGEDLAGEARAVNALVPPQSHVLDAGCGPGRVAGALSAMGHRVVGVDIDPVLIAAAREDFSQVPFREGDLAQLENLTELSELTFDAVVCAGNVLPFMEPGTQAAGLAAMARLTRDGGRLVVGFQTHRGYSTEMLLRDAKATDWVPDGTFSTWEFHRPEADPSFVVGLFSRPARPPR